MVVVDHLLFHIALKVTRDVYEPSPHCSPQELYLGPHLQTPSGLRSLGFLPAHPPPYDRETGP